MKRVLLMATTLLALFFTCLVTAYASNEIDIKKLNPILGRKNLQNSGNFDKIFVQSVKKTTEE